LRFFKNLKPRFLQPNSIQPWFISACTALFDVKLLFTALSTSIRFITRGEILHDFGTGTVTVYSFWRTVRDTVMRTTSLTSGRSTWCAVSHLLCCTQKWTLGMINWRRLSVELLITPATSSVFPFSSLRTVFWSTDACLLIYLFILRRRVAIDIGSG